MTLGQGERQSLASQQRPLLILAAGVEITGSVLVIILLVDEPERTVAQIAADCGFGSSTYFSDRFRQHYGMSPTDFRTEAAKSGMI